MNVWVRNSIKNLIPLSENNTDFSEAIKEWSFTGNIIDNEHPTQTCELCEHDSIRYQYEIANALANNLWVGSKCIDKFDIKVFDEEGNEITTGKETHLHNLAKANHRKRVLNQLQQNTNTEKIWDKTKTRSYFKSELDQYCINAFNNKKIINARILNYIFLRFTEENIAFDPKAFGIKINSDENKELLLSLNQEQFERIEKSLSSNQLKYYKENKKH